jgi:hypothetical protein
VLNHRDVNEVGQGAERRRLLVPERFFRRRRIGNRPVDAGNVIDDRVDVVDGLTDVAVGALRGVRGCWTSREMAASACLQSRPADARWWRSAIGERRMRRVETGERRRRRTWCTDSRLDRVEHLRDAPSRAPAGCS